MHPARELNELLTDGEELTIVCHNNPDPDCLASTFALGWIAMAVGIDEHHILYSGDISHQQNRAFVDHAVPGTNNRVPEATPVGIVIDHHTSEEIEARFIDSIYGSINNGVYRAGFADLQAAGATTPRRISASERYRRGYDEELLRSDASFISPREGI